MVSSGVPGGRGKLGAERRYLPSPDAVRRKGPRRTTGNFLFTAESTISGEGNLNLSFFKDNERNGIIWAAIEEGNHLPGWVLHGVREKGELAGEGRPFAFR